MRQTRSVPLAGYIMESEGMEIMGSELVQEPVHAMEPLES